MIERKIASGEGQVVYTSNFEDRPDWDNHWLVIRMRYHPNDCTYKPRSPRRRKLKHGGALSAFQQLDG